MKRVLILSDGETWDYESNCQFYDADRTKDRVVVLSDGETWDYEARCEVVEIPDDHEVVEVRRFNVISKPKQR